MKIFFKLITPLVLAAFIYAVTPAVCRADEPVPKVIVSYTLNLQDWTDIVNIDLSAVVYNPATGRNEIVVEIPYTNSVEKAMFFKSSATNMSFYYFNVPISSDIILPALVVPQCNPIIIGVLVLVVAGIVIYVLVKTCKKLLPPNPPPDK